MSRAVTPPVAWLALAAPVALAGMSVAAVVRTYSAAPFQDYWDTIWWWREIQARGLTFSYLISQHNEHRILLPRLVFLADLQWFRGTNVLNLAAIGVMQATGAAIFLLAGLRRGGALAVLGAAVAAALLASLAQWENFFWAFQVQGAAVCALGAWAIFLFSGAPGEDARRPSRLAGGVALLAAATFSMANGLFAGLAMVLVGLVARRWREASIAVLATAALAGLYLWGYQPVAAHSPASLALEQPLSFVGYALACLGNVWGLGRLPLAIAAGLAGAGLTAAMAFLVFRDRGRDTVQAAMFGLALFAGLTAGATALGRLSLGIELSLSPRYATVSCYFWAAQGVFWSLWAQRQPRALAAAVAGLLVVALLGLFVVQEAHGPGLAVAHQRILRGAEAMRGDLSDEAALRGLYPDPARVRELTPFLREQRLSIFARDGERESAR